MLVKAIEYFGFTEPLTRKLGVSPDEIKEIILQENDAEILEIEYHKKKLVITALNSNTLFKDAALKLGISQRGLYRMIRAYGLEKRKNPEGFEYVETETKIKRKVA